MVTSCLQLRIQRIIAERFLPILDDVFVAHKTHILRTTAISGGVTCIAGILGSKSVELKASGKGPTYTCCKQPIRALANYTGV